jgi:replicative DNA helicase
MSNLFNIDYECNLIAGIIQHPEIYSEIAFLNYKDFGKTNSPIWQIIENTITNKGSPTPVILAEKLKSIGITLDGLENYDYLESLRIRPIDKKGITHVAKELKKLTLVRTTYERAVKLQQEVVKLKDSPAKDILKCIDDNLGKSLITLDCQGEQAINLYERLPDYIEELGNNPQDFIGYKVPYESWMNSFGPIRPGSMYIVGARPSNSKSALLADMGRKIVDINPDKKISLLYLDTEMTPEDQSARMAASMTGCPYWLVEGGLYRKSPEWMPKMRAAMNEIRNNKKGSNFWFKQVGSMEIDDLCSFVKNWYYTNVGRGGNALLVYDYLKVLGSDKGSNNNSQEWEKIALKCQKMKNLIDELNCPLLTAIQLNRQGITSGKSGDDLEMSESSFSMGDRVNWLAAFTAILRKKTPDEILRDGISMGTHSLYPIKKRYIGAGSSGHNDLVKIVEKINGKDIIKYKENYIFLNIDNFTVEDRGDFRNFAQLTGKTKIPLKENKQDGLL